MSAQPAQPAPPLPLPKKPFTRGIGASGLVEARQQNTSIGVPVAGLVKKVLVDVWGKVEIGTPLLLLDDRELQAQFLEDQAQVRLKAAQLDRVRDQLERLQAVDDSRAISADELRNRQLDVAVAAADLSAAEAGVARAKELIERLIVRSPINGTVLQVNLRDGEYAAPGAATAPLIVGSIEEVWVRAEVDEQVAPRVQPGKPAVGYLKGDAVHPIAMEFVRIEPCVIPKRSLTGASTERVDTRVLQIIYQFRNPADRRIYVGQQIDLFIEGTL